ncbi:glycine cleavage system protein GcvH [Candidatus Bathyarchaeota archaeon]|nr:glycine cleavage system protein GcvH [Candidatus Bathyarchaeota archaeon]MBS7630280.1 glycine cleavage system protein GcvH [Candidatus Bathyarchaeota archaeon]
MSQEYEIPEGLHYTKEHEWAKSLEDDTVLVGVTDYAQKQLHEIVYVELPEIGREVKSSDSIGAVESVKAVSDIFSPVAGTVIEVNETLIDSPELINEDPYKRGWIVRIKPKDLKADLAKLLDPEAYRRHLVEQSH